MCTTPPVRPGRSPEFTARPQASPDYRLLAPDDPIAAALPGSRYGPIPRTLIREHAPAFAPDLTLTEVYASCWATRERAWFFGVHREPEHDVASGGKLGGRKRRSENRKKPAAPRRLDGTANPLHDFRLQSDLVLNARSSRHWLRFFSYFVHGEEGPFLIVDDPQRVAEHVDRPANHRAVAALTKHLQPLTRVRTRARRFAERYVYDATLLYHTSLFRSRFAVSPDGEVEMVSDDVLVKKTGLRVRRPLR